VVDPEWPVSPAGVIDEATPCSFPRVAGAAAPWSAGPPLVTGGWSGFSAITTLMQMKASRTIRHACFMCMALGWI